VNVSRRDVLLAGALFGASTSLNGCGKIVGLATEHLGQTIPETIHTPESKDIDPLFHLLCRAGYGPWPGELDQARSLGAQKWIEEQLNYKDIEDRLCDWRAARFESIELDPGTCYEFKKPVLRNEICNHTLVRAVYSKRQLYEAMVEFWTDHLNINIDKGDCIYLKPADDRLVVRPHALGKFRDLIRASALSPAMLVYLDGKENKRARPEDIPNENYARELLELHTLGVHGGYKQKDVYETARCLTGWRVHGPWQRGKVYFESNMHDQGEKNLLGRQIAANGSEHDLDSVLDLVCKHPSTAQHIATKLVRRFVADDPPQSLVKRVADDFTRTDGEIKSVMRTIFLSTEFQAAKGTKLKRPFYFVASCLRSLGVDVDSDTKLVDYLARMGQGPFQYPTPDGYPDKPQAWVGTLLWRWNFAFSLTANSFDSAHANLEKLATALGGTPERGFQPQQLLRHFLGRRGTDEEVAALSDYIARAAAKTTKNKAELVGLILASPAFQRY
jgi:uncharacterized protein (DUF1800 family)